MNRLRFRRLQVAVGRENPSYPTQARTHVGRAFVGELGLWLWLVVGVGLVGVLFDYIKCSIVDATFNNQ